MNFQAINQAITESLKQQTKKLPTKMMLEARKARLFQYIEDPDKNFAIISAFRNENDMAKNIKNTDLLKADVRNLGLGYIELVGGYVETDDKGNKVEVAELSLLIPGIGKAHATALGTLYDQESILYKDKESMSYIETTGDAVGSVQASFIFGQGAKNFTVNDVMNPYFSRFKKGAHKNDNISFVLAEASYDGELFRQSKSGGNCPPVWKQVDIDHIIGKKENQISEAKVYRMIDRVLDPQFTFGIVSPYRKDLIVNGKNLTGDELEAENKKRFEKMKDEVFEKYGSFIELRGAYKEKGHVGDDVFEQSLYIPDIDKKSLIELGKKYDQDSVIWHGDGKFELIGCGDGSVWMEFSFEIPDVTNLSKKEAEEALKKAKEANKLKSMELIGTWLKKGSQRKHKIVFQNKIEPGTGRALVTEGGGNQDVLWNDVMEFDESAGRSASRFNRLFHSDNQAFGMISAERTFIGNGNYVEVLTKKQNRERGNRLSARLREFRKDAVAKGFKLSFIPVFGGYNDLQAKTTAEELGSLEHSFIVSIGCEDDERKREMEKFFYDRMLELGAMFDQESVLIKDSDGLRYVGTLNDSMDAEKDGKSYKREANFGKVLDRFSGEGFNISGKDAFEYFTRLKNKDISFIWTPSEANPSGMVESFLKRKNPVTKEMIYQKPLVESKRPGAFTYKFTDIVVEVGGREFTFDAKVNLFHYKGFAGSKYEPAEPEMVAYGSIVDITNLKETLNSGDVVELDFESLSAEEQKLIKDAADDYFSEFSEKHQDGMIGLMGDADIDRYL